MPCEETYRLALSLGGMLTGEHGSGPARRGFMPLGLEEPQTEVIRRIPEPFDPHCVLNAGKIFP